MSVTCRTCRGEIRLVHGPTKDYYRHVPNLPWCNDKPPRPYVGVRPR